MSDAYVPMPLTCHPFYDEQAEGIRSHLHLPAVLVAEPTRFSASFYDVESSAPLSASTTTRVLTVKKCAGPAPYVGDPMFAHRVYEWFAAVDDLGRHVAGEASLSGRLNRYH